MLVYDQEREQWAHYDPATGSFWRYHRFDPKKPAPVGGWVGVLGQPVRVRQRFRIEAVGMDWDGTFKPIGELT